MMKAIVTIILALTLAGCSVSKTVVRTSVHPETQHHINENTVFFIQLVNTIRLNSNVTRPSTDLKNHINMLAFRAGLIPQCVGSSGCYLTKPEFDGKITIENEFVVIDYGNRYVKIQDVNQAAHIIYG
jgi:hypothetical protein